MNPLYFGSTDKRLFGVYHPPVAEKAGRRAVVLCYPAFSEYLHSHRAFRQLATLLSKEGYPTLRFDYYATGDSDGASADADLQQWGDDVLTATDEALALGACDSVSLVGLRLGATIAASVAARHSEIDRLVLWDPVVSGRSYVDELHRAHVEFEASVGLGSRSAEADGIMGFPMSSRLHDALRGLELGGDAERSTKPALLMTSFRHADYERFAAGRHKLTHECIPSGEFWASESLDPRELVPIKALRRVVAWLGSPVAL